MITLETQPLIGSLLPLLPSVQILFDSFCGTGVVISAAIGPRRSKARSRGISRSKKDLPNDHARNPIPGRVFASFATFCSNPLRFLLWHRSCHFSGDQTRSLKRARAAVYHARKRTYGMITLETQSLIGSLLPL